VASDGGLQHGNGAPERDESASSSRAEPRTPPRPTLNTAVRRRRADRAFYLRLAGAIRQNARALERLKR
jgi:hypothetical protein